MVWFGFLIFMFLIFLVLLPPWPYMRERDFGYAPSLMALAVVLGLLLLWWFGLIVMWHPWRPIAY